MSTGGASGCWCNLCRALPDQVHFAPEDEQDRAFQEPVRQALADVLTTLAATTRAAGAYCAGAQPAGASHDDVAACLAAVLPQRDRLAGLLAVSPKTTRRRPAVCDASL